MDIELFRFINLLGVLSSRRLWQHVTESLRKKDIDKATEHKRILEERQRADVRHRTETDTPWRTQYFESEVGDRYCAPSLLCRIWENIQQVWQAT